MFNKKRNLRKRVKELEEENSGLKQKLKGTSLVIPEEIEDDSYGSLIQRIIHHAGSSEYEPYQTELLQFIVNELKILQQKWKKNPPVDKKGMSASEVKEICAKAWDAAVLRNRKRNEHPDFKEWIKENVKS